MKELRVPVRYLVEFLLREGDIKSGSKPTAKNAMLEGGRIHRKLQRSMGSTYRSEVSLSFRKEYDDFALTVWGRADGIYLSRGVTVVDEIKGTYLNIETMEEPVPVHLAQASCYAYMQALSEGKEKIRVQVRYCNMANEKIRRFSVDRTFAELEAFFLDLLERYYPWAKHLAEWEEKRNRSIKGMEFPFEYRPGQHELTADVYRTILRKKQLFVQAATGIGKTMSVIFPSVHALGEGLADRIFYLTAKTVTGSVAAEAVGLLRRNGLELKSLYMTAKDKLCPLEESVCDPQVCPRACGHFDRINAVLYQMLTGTDSYSREGIARAAEEGCVCPYELQLDLADFTDLLIGDYNYAFDPEARLKRFFSGNSAKSESIFLIDEAHNLVHRAREMFSARLRKEDVLALRRRFPKSRKKMAGAFTRVNNALLEIKRAVPEEGVTQIPFPEKLELSLLALAAAIEEYLEEPAEEELRPDLLSFYFEVRHFLGSCGSFDEHYLAYAGAGPHSFSVTLFCVNPAKDLQQVLDLGRSAVLFSATLLPVTYYQELLSEQESYAIYVPSPFNAKNRIILNGTDVSSRYKDRNDRMYEKIASYLSVLVNGKKGNYIAYFPSYTLMKRVYEAFVPNCPEGLKLLPQSQGMNELERETYLASFSEKNSWQLGFCVLGGLFSEGIDLTGDRLIGVAVVGTGLPMVTKETDLLRAYYDEHEKDGFDHAYKFPGMNKVQQAAGRVIRTVEDKGVILLLDDRFAQAGYRSLFPREWNDVRNCTLKTAGELIRAFWEETEAGPETLPKEGKEETDSIK